jgi:hypothetical protein
MSTLRFELSPVSRKRFREKHCFVELHFVKRYNQEMQDNNTAVIPAWKYFWENDVK